MNDNVDYDFPINNEENPFEANTIVFYNKE